MTAYTFADYAQFITPPINLNGTMEWEPTWVIQDLILKDQLNIIGGADKVGKSLLRTHLIVCAVTGCPALGIKEVHHKPEKVLLLAGEENEKIEEARFRRAARKLGFDEGELPVQILPPTGFMLDNPKLVEQFKQFLADKGFDLVVIDPLVRFHEKDENVQGQISPVLNRIRLIANNVATVIMIHHTHQPKETDIRMSLGQLLRGSSDFGAIYDHLLILKRAPGRNKRKRELLFGVRHEDEADPIEIEIVSEGTKTPFTWEVFQPTKARSNYSLTFTPIPVSDLAKRIGRRKQDVEEALQELEMEGLAERTPDGWRSKTPP